MNSLELKNHSIFPEVLIGVNIVREDSRGQFRRLLAIENLPEFDFKHCNYSSNVKSGTWRGLHMQEYPHSETKIVTCISGRIIDVIVDMRPTSANYRKHIKVNLTEFNGNFVIIPKGFAHGYLTLVDNTKVIYFVDVAYSPEFEVGFNVNDPLLSIDIKNSVTTISDKDSNWPMLSGNE